MLVVVGERLNAVRWSDAVIDAARRRWDDDPLRAALDEEALPVGSVSRSRLSSLLGIYPERCLNLLEPSKTLGAWSATRAATVADAILAWARAGGHRLILLGRRVAKAFGVTGRLAFGDTRSVSGVECLVAPHPSGRSRALNDVARRHDLREKLRAFAGG